MSSIVLGIYDGVCLTMLFFKLVNEGSVKNIQTILAFFNFNTRASLKILEGLLDLLELPTMALLLLDLSSLNCKLKFRR